METQCKCVRKILIMRRETTRFLNTYVCRNGGLFFAKNWILNWFDLDNNYQTPGSITLMETRCVVICFFLFCFAPFIFFNYIVWMRKSLALFLFVSFFFRLLNDHCCCIRLYFVRSLLSGWSTCFGAKIFVLNVTIIQIVIDPLGLNSNAAPSSGLTNILTLKINSQNNPLNAIDFANISLCVYYTYETM